MSNNNSPTHDDLRRDLAADLARFEEEEDPGVWREAQWLQRLGKKALESHPAASRRAIAAEPMVEFLRDESQAKGEEIARLRRELEGKDKALALLNAGFERQCELADGLKQQSRKAGAEVERLRVAVRRHRDCRGDDRCWLDDEELYRCLPEGYEPPARDREVELALCEKYVASRHNPATEYVSPQRRVEELEAEVARLQKQIDGHVERIAAQSALLSRRAEKEAPG